MSEYYVDEMKDEEISSPAMKDEEEVSSMSEEERNVRLLFKNATEQNEEDFLKRTELLISLRSRLIYDREAPYIITPDVPLQITSKKRLFKDIMMWKIFMHSPGSVDVANDKVYRRVHLETGEWERTNPLYPTQERHEGKCVQFVPRDEAVYRETNVSIVMGKPEDSNGYIFFRGPDNIVRSYSSWTHFISNNLLYAKEYQGEIDKLHVFQVYLVFAPQNKETLLLRSRDSIIFMHHCEWYECKSNAILHVRSNGRKTITVQDGIIRKSYYYKGHLLLLLMNGETQLLTLG